MSDEKRLDVDALVERLRKDGAAISTADYCHVANWGQEAIDYGGSGFDMIEAAGVIERLRAEIESLKGNTVPTWEPTAEEVETARSGRKINAIKDYRYRTGVSLTMAKATIERALATPEQPPQGGV